MGVLLALVPGGTQRPGIFLAEALRIEETAGQRLASDLVITYGGG